MSGHVVATPMVIPQAFPLVQVATGLAGGAAFVICAGGLAAGVKALTDKCVDAANEKRIQEKLRHIQWQAYCEGVQRQAEDISAAESAVRGSEKRLAAMALGEAAEQRQKLEGEHPLAPEARAQLKLGESRISPAQSDAALREFAGVLEELPAVLRAAKGSPVPRLEDQLKRMRARLAEGDTPDRQELAGFRDTLRETLAAFTADLEARRARQAALRDRLEAALDVILYAEQLALSLPEEIPALGEAAALRAQLGAMLDSGGAPEGEIAMIERRAATMRLEIEQAVVDASWQEGLSESLMRNLREMGYETLQPFGGAGPVNTAVLRVPGGEQLRVALHKNHQMAFEVVHERPAGADSSAPLSVAERAHLALQEQRWCGDLHELIRRLVAEGFPYQVSFEHELPEESVKVVLVETADDLLAEEDAEGDETEKRRFLD